MLVQVYLYWRLGFTFSFISSHTVVLGAFLQEACIISVHKKLNEGSEVYLKKN